MQAIQSLGIKTKKATQDFSNTFLGVVSSRVFLYATLAFFILQAVFIALSTKAGIPPDENYHIAFIRLFTENNLSPFLVNQEGYFFLGEVVRTPFFIYHYILSFIAFPFKDFEYLYLILRFVNISLAFASILVVVKISKELRLGSLVRNLSIFMICNTLMFVFLSAGVSYDNLFILISLLVILFFLKLLKKPSPTNILFFCVLLLFGSLIKVTFLPIGFITSVILLLTYRRSLGKNLFSYPTYRLATHTRVNKILIVVAVGLLLLVTHRYALNVIRYKNYTPSCLQVQTYEQCSQNRLFTRNERVFGSDRRTAEKGLVEYLPVWSFLIQERTFGISSHKSILPTKSILIVTSILILLYVVAISRYFRRSEDKKIGFLLLITGFYLAILVLENYSIYTASGRVTFVVHGRYTFAVLPIVFLLGNYYLAQLFSKKTSLACLVLIILPVFLYSSLPSYINKTNAEWHTNKLQPINQKLKRISP